MPFLSDMPEIVTENEPLGPLTYFGLGGPARWLARPRSVSELAEVARRAHHEGIPLYVLGLGANLLVNDDGVDGVVVRLDAPLLRRVEWETDRALIDGGSSNPELEGVLVSVAAGADMARLSLDAVRRGLAGIECMAGIPGTLGGIVRMNAGGRFGQISDAVCDITVVDTSGCVRRLSRDEVGFSYRHTQLSGLIVCGVTLALQTDDPRKLRERYGEIWNYKRKSQPLADASAGCAFKNPKGDSAGRLIDAAGLKGFTVGGAYISPQHANFIAARSGASARDVLAVIRHARRMVADKFGIELELEIQVWESRTAPQPELAA